MTNADVPAPAPHFLIVPGLNDSGPTHWQSLWGRLLRNSSRAELGDWSAPQRSQWVGALDDAIRATHGPIILCAHSLGCLAVAWWAALRGQKHGWPVAGALLIAPPDCDRPSSADTLRDFGPTPMVKLPFPAILAASRDDHYADIEQSQRMARYWGAHFVDTGQLGHINADSGIGLWPAGLSLLGRVLTLAGHGRSRGGAIPAESLSVAA